MVQTAATSVRVCGQPSFLLRFLTRVRAPSQTTESVNTTTTTFRCSVFFNTKRATGTEKLLFHLSIMPSIAVIGGGPAGMSFCHAIETMQRDEGVGQDVQVTCFERSTRPGGIWKSADPSSKTEKINMYEELWTNGPSQSIEFPDYTFDEHFGRPVTVYMPRQEVLGYLIGRVTKKCPDFFQKYVKFGTEVVNVSYKEGCFRVSTRVAPTGETSETSFDKVIWACGDNGKPYIPKRLETLLKDFKGRVIHSSETGNLDNDFRDKRVLFIGGGYSAEDLALQACKLNVKKAYISSRTESSDGTYLNAWPQNKVEVLKEQTPIAVGECGRSIQFGEVTWTFGSKYTASDKLSTEIHDIDTVVLCTGYDTNFDMLSEDLRPKESPPGRWKLDVPDDWKMPENSMTKHVHDVKPRNTSYIVDHTNPELFQGVLIANPNMMFVWTYSSTFPLVAADASAWLLARYSNGSVELPSVAEMKRLNCEQALEELKHPYIRYYADENYHKALNSVPGFDEDECEFEEEWEEFVEDSERYTVHQLAHLMKQGKYMMDLGDMKKLSKEAELLLHFDALSGSHRQDITPRVIAKQPLKTFRDYENASEFYSLYTGTKAVPLSQLWMKIDHRVLLDCEEKKNSS